MVYILIILLLLALLAYTHFSKQRPSQAPVQQVVPPSKQHEQFVQEPKVSYENVSKTQLPEVLEERPITQKPVVETAQPVHMPPEEKQILFQHIQNPIVEKPTAPVVETQREKPLKEEIGKVVNKSEERAAQEDDLPSLSIFKRRQREEPIVPVELQKQRAAEEKGEAVLKELEREFIKEDRKIGEEVSMPSLQDLPKGVGEKIEAISPVLRSAVVDEEDEESKPSLDILEENREIEEIVSSTMTNGEKILPEVQEDAHFVPQIFETKPVEEKTAQETVLPPIDKQEAILGESHPEFRKEAHFIPEDFEASKKQEELRPALEVAKEKSPKKTMKFLPETLTEDITADQGLEEETQNRLTPEPAQANEIEQAANDKQTVGKNTIKRNFNFRTNKNKIESILKKDVNNISLNRDTTSQPDFTMDRQDSILSAPESTVDRINQVTLEEPALKEDSLVRTIEENDHHSTKPRGFNFKNPKKKTLPEKKADNVITQEAPQSENIDPTAEGGVRGSPKAVDIGKAETKKMKGFNFRNPGRVKNE